MRSLFLFIVWLVGFGFVMIGDVLSLFAVRGQVFPIFPAASVCDTEIVIVQVPSEILLTSKTVDQVPLGLHITL